jgi:hypothetical protein
MSRNQLSGHAQRIAARFDAVDVTSSHGLLSRRQVYLPDRGGTGTAAVPTLTPAQTLEHLLRYLHGDVLLPDTTQVRRDHVSATLIWFLIDLAGLVRGTLGKSSSSLRVRFNEGHQCFIKLLLSMIDRYVSHDELYILLIQIWVHRFSKQPPVML